MSTSEDPASFLEQFCHDVSNIPAEVAHLMEEADAKQLEMNECQSTINQRDGSLQKFIKLNGSLVLNPKEDAYTKIILASYDKIDALQLEKRALIARADKTLLRHIRKFDLKVREMEADGALPVDPTLPSLLRDSPGNLVPRPTANNPTGTNTPLQSLSGNTGGGTVINPGIVAQRMLNHTQMRAPAPSTVVMPPHHPTMGNPSHLSSVQAMAQVNSLTRHRESSAASLPDPKRRRLVGSLPVPVIPSGLGRSTSLGPGTPKALTSATTPGSRQGSVGPRLPKKSTKKLAPHQMRKALLKNKKKRARAGRSGISPSTTGDEDASNASEADGSDDETSRAGGDGAGDDMDPDEDDGDDTKYCTCQQPSRGNMIGCDNARCRYQWFHWECVGLTHEPEGDWLCPDCRQLPERQIKRVP